MSEINDQIKDLEAQVAAMEGGDTNTDEATSSVEEPVTSNPPKTDDQMVQEMVERKVAAELAAIKKKLDDAYSARDQAVKAKVLLEEEKRSQEIKRMEEEGRHKEVAELKLAELQAKVEALSAKNTELSRDAVVRQEIATLDFRSDMAADMAYDRMVRDMVQDENGAWIHKSGVSIKEYVDHFKKSDENSFLFKAKVNSGAGTQTPVGTIKPTNDKKLSEMTSEEMLAHFAQQVPGQTGGF